MSQIHPVHPNIIIIQEVASKPPANPLLSTEFRSKTPAPSLKASSSVNTANSTTQRVLSNRILFNDQRCFLTGSVSTEIQACRLINAIRPKQKKAKMDLKAQVEFILTRQCFNGKRPFFLDSLMNCLAFDVHWHGQLDKRGSFCVVVPMEQILLMASSLLLSNITWANRAARDPSAPRDLDTTIEPFLVTTTIVLVLRPQLFLPDNKPILINTERTLRARGAALPPASVDEAWVLYRVEAGTPFLVNNSGDRFDNRQFESERTPDDALSVFSLLVNAHYRGSLGNKPQQPSRSNPRKIFSVGHPGL
ncbi:hypothetical protein B0H17DRAFT_1202924 [Mycena rosella]|uniref:Uncharacterized protein n=1 Tax=Mycena rosella TaxID=1033263 RepID=A0AAD7GFA0_MYCRO|nr:hypothetical protein B0H17DRAFT_1202924 [Mycena rosella]